MNVMNLLDKIADVPGDVLKWLATPGGQALVGIGETALEVAVPQATGVVNIFNRYLAEEIKVQALAMAAGAAPGTASAQKAAAVVNAVGPEVLMFAEKNGLEPLTADELLKLNNLAVEFLQVFRPKGVPAKA
jgi:hypothetical protein